MNLVWHSKRETLQMIIADLGSEENNLRIPKVNGSCEMSPESRGSFPEKWAETTGYEEKTD